MQLLSSFGIGGVEWIVFKFGHNSNIMGDAALILL